MTKKKTAGIIRLEERVLFEAAAAPEIAALVAAEGQEGGDGNGEDASSDNDNLEKTAAAAALAAGPDGAAIGDAPVTENGVETAEGVGEDAGNDGDSSSDDSGDADDAGQAQEALLPDPVEGLEIGNTDSVVDGTPAASADDLDLDDPSSIVIENGSSEVITVEGNSSAEADQAEPDAEEIAAEINANSAAAAAEAAEAADGSSEAAPERHELVIVNATTDNLDALLGEVEEGRDVLVLEADSADPLADIQAYMEGKDYTYDAVHIVTHGNQSGLLLGGSLIEDGSSFGVMKSSLSDGADILIYGCNTAAGEAGHSFLQDIADATGADIAASTDMTSSSHFGGNWNLEYAIGDVNVDSLTVSDAWVGKLATINIDGKGGTEGVYKDLNDYWTKNKLTPGSLYEFDTVILMADVTESYTGDISLYDDKGGISGGEVRFLSNGADRFTYTISDSQTIYVGGKTNSDSEVPLALGYASGANNVAIKGTIAVGLNDTLYLNKSVITGTVGLGENALLSTEGGFLKASVQSLNIVANTYATINNIDLSVLRNLTDATANGCELRIGDGASVNVEIAATFTKGTITLGDNTQFGTKSGTVNYLTLGDDVTLKLLNYNGTPLHGEVSVTHDVAVSGTTVTMNDFSLLGTVNLSNAGEIKGTSGELGTLRVIGTGTVTNKALSADNLSSNGAVTLTVGTGGKLIVGREIDYSDDTIVLDSGTFGAKGNLKTLDINGTGTLTGSELAITDTVDVDAGESLSLLDDSYISGTVALSGAITGNSGSIRTLVVNTSGERTINNSDLTVTELDGSSGTVTLTVQGGLTVPSSGQFDFGDDTIHLNGGSLTAYGTLDKLTIGANGGTLKDGDLTVGDAAGITIDYAADVYVEGNAKLTAASLVNNGTIAGSGAGAVLDFTGDVTNSGTMADSVSLRITGDLTNTVTGVIGPVFSVSGNVDNSGWVDVIREVGGDLVNRIGGTIMEQGKVSGVLDNLGYIGTLYNVADPTKVNNNGTIDTLMITVTGENAATGLTFTTVNEAFDVLANPGSAQSINGNDPLSYGFSFALNPYVYSDSDTFRADNDVVSLEKATTLTAGSGQTKDIVLDTTLQFASMPAAASTVIGYSLYGTATLTDLIIGSGVSVTLKGASSTYTFDNVGVKIANGGTLKADKTNLVFTGNGVRATYEFLSSDAYLMTGAVYGTDGMGGVSVFNEGKMSIDGSKVTFTREALAGTLFPSIDRYLTYGIKNDGTDASITISGGSEITFDLGSAADNIDSRADDAYAVWNVNGLLRVEDSTITINTHRAGAFDGIDPVKSVALFNESALKDKNAVDGLSFSDAMADADVAVENSKILANGNREGVYGVLNSGDAYVEDSWILAQGEYIVSGIKNNASGHMEFNVADPNYTTEAALDKYFADKGVDFAKYQDNPGGLISDYILPGVSGKNITGTSGNVENTSSVFNAGQLYIHYSGSVPEGKNPWVGSSTGYTYVDVPVLLLYGEVYTLGTAEDGHELVLTDLNHVTVAGKSNEATSLIESSRTATVLLNDVSATTLVNDGSQVHVTGTYDKSIFSVYSATSNLLNWTNTVVSRIENNAESSLYSMKDGEMFFGIAATEGDSNLFHVNKTRYDNRVEFASDVSYTILNEARMTISNFMGLGTDENHPVSIKNTDRAQTVNGSDYRVIGTMLIENPIDTQKEVNGQMVNVTDANGNPISLTDDNGNVTMYVDYRSGTIFEADPAVQDLGIVNTGAVLTINNVNVLNTNASSVAVTNHGGVFSMTSGSLMGTYSGLDNIERVSATVGAGSDYAITLKIEQSTANLNDITVIAGSNFGVRNTGEFNLNNTDTALITNDFNLAVEKGSVLDALFTPFRVADIPGASEAIGIANYTIASAMWMETIAAANGVPVRVHFTIDVSSYRNYTPYSYEDLTGAKTTAAASWKVNLLNTGGDLLGTKSYTPSSHAVEGSSPAITHYAYGKNFTNSTVKADNVQFRLSQAMADTIAVYNEATATVTSIKSFENYLDSIHNVGIDNKKAASSWEAWLYVNSNWDGTDLNMLKDTGYFINGADGGTDSSGTEGEGDGDGEDDIVTTGSDGQKRESRAYLSFSCKINASSVENSDILTLEGLDGTGEMSISGSSYRVTPSATLTLLNLIVTSPENTTYAIENRGTLIVENTFELLENGSTNSSGAYISAKKGTAILNKADLTLINATVKNSVNGIENAGGTLYMVNSQLLDNSGWALKSTSGQSYILDSSIVFNANGVNVEGGTVTLENSILVNSGMKTDGTYFTADGVNYSGNINADNTNVVGSADDAASNTLLLGRIYTYNKETGSYFQSVEINRLNLSISSANPALSGGVYIAVKFDEEGAVTGYEISTDSSGFSEGYVFVSTDKDGYSRLPDTGSSSIIIGATSYHTVVPPEPPEPPGPVTYVVNTFTDDVNPANSLFSLREAFALAETSQGSSFTVTFDVSALLAEGGYTFVLNNVIGMATGSIVVDFAALASSLGHDVVITISDTFASDTMFGFGNTAGVTGPDVSISGVTIDGSKSTTGNVAVILAGATLSLKDVNVYGGAGYYLEIENSGSSSSSSSSTSTTDSESESTADSSSTDSSTDSSGSDLKSGYYGGAFLVMGTLSISGEGVYSGGSKVTRGGIIASENGIVNVTGNITFQSGKASEMGGFLLQAGEKSVSNIGDENSNIIITGMDAPEGAVVAQLHGETNLINVVVRNNGKMDSETHTAASKELFAATGDFTVVNASIYDNTAEAIFGLYSVEDGSSEEFLERVFLVDSSLVQNSSGFVQDKDGNLEYDSDGYGKLDYATKLWSEGKKTVVTDSNGNTTTTYTGGSKGDVYILNSLIDVDLNGDYEGINLSIVSTLTGEKGWEAFSYDGYGELQLDPETGVPIITDSASAGGVIAAVYTDSNGRRALAYRTLDDTVWRGMDGAAVSQFEPDIDSIIRSDAIGEISVSGNGSHRYLAQSNITIGAYSRAYADTLTATGIVVTTNIDELDGNMDISLREAAKYARKLYEQTGTVFTITFADGLQQRGDVLLDSTLVLDSPVTIDGGSDITVSAGGFIGDSMFRVTGTEITLTNITLNGENNVAYDENGSIAGLAAQGGILHVEKGGSISVSGVTFENGYAWEGGAVYNQGEFAVTGSSFTDNSALLGGAIYSESSLTVTDSVFSGNYAYDGAAIYGKGSVSVSSSQFTGNDGTLSVVRGTDVNVSGSTFASNSAGNAMVNGTNSVNVSGSTFNANTAEILVGAPSVNVSGSTFSANETTVLLDGTTLNVSGSTFTSNKAENLLVGSSVNVTGSTFTGNEAAENLLAGSSVNVSGSTFTSNKAENLLSGADISVSGSTFASNELSEALADASGNVSVAGSTFTSNKAENLLSGTSVSVSGSTFTENAFDYLINAPGDVRISDSAFVRNTAEESLVSGEARITVSGSRFEDNRAMWALLETAGDVTVSGSRFEGNSVENGSLVDAYGAESSVSVTNSTFANNEVADAIVFATAGIFLDEVSLTNNIGSYALQSDGNIAVISTTIADTEGDGTVKVSAGENAYILNSTVADVSGDAGVLVEGSNVYVVNSIVVSNDTADVTSGTLSAAYSYMSSGSGDHVTGNWSYDDAFAGNTVSADGTLHPVESLASQRGSFVMYSVNGDGSLNVAYSDTYSDQVISTGYYYDPRVNQNWTTLTASAPVNGTVVRYAHEQEVTMPGIGSYWNGSYSVDYGPGLNSEFIDASYNGVFGYYGMNNYALAVSGLSGGIALAGSMIWPETVSFDPIRDAGTRSGFRVSERMDLGGIPSAGTYITETVEASGDDLESEYYMTPTTADGLPLIPEQTAEEGDLEPEGLEATLAEISESFGDGVEKVASLFKHADVFKDDFDKALEELLGIKA
ncbi:MAG: DUF4347 domain-containing protein [Lentisphaeria bacterium]|nr:DUF4347 domain-containing protein [Lentisphaeria bacterium]